MRNNFSQTWTLVKNQLSLFVSSKTSLISFVLLSLLVMVINILGLLVINSDKTTLSKLTTINIVIAVNALLFGIITILLTVNVFIIQVRNNICKIELRYGYRVLAIYLSKILFINLLVFIAYFFNFLICLIIFTTATRPGDILSYRMFISSQGWIAIIILLVMSLTILISKFFNESSTSIILMVIIFVITLLPGAGIIFNFNSNNNNNYLVQSRVQQKVFQVFENNENLKQIRNEIEFVNDEDIVLGLFDYEEGYENYREFQKLVADKLNTDNQISEWWPRSSENNFEDPIVEISNKLLTTKEMAPYQELLYLFKELFNNNSLAKETGLLNNKWIGPNYDEDLILLKDKFGTSDNYIFNRYFLIALQIVQTVDLELPNEYSDFEIDLGPAPRKNINKSLIENILNPVNHLNLMFWGVDYENEVATSFYAKQQNIFQSPNNINFSSKTNKNDWGPWEEIELFLIVRPEIYYLIYSAFSFGSIAFSYITFNRRIKG